MFNMSIVKDRNSNEIIASFKIPNHAKSYCEMLNTSVGKKRYHWHETKGRVVLS